MSRLTDFLPRLGAPDRVTVYTGSAGAHTWMGGARVARVTVIGAGGAGGQTGKYLLSSTYYYNAGGGGGAGAIARGILQLEVLGEAAVPYAAGSGAAGADGGASYFGGLYAPGGKKGSGGSTSSTNAVGAGGAEVGVVAQTITGTAYAPRLPLRTNILEGVAGSPGVNGGGNTGGAGAGTLYGHGGAAVANPASGAPLAGVSPATGQYGAGASGGTWAASTATNHTVPASAKGGDGAVIVEEWT